MNIFYLDRDPMLAAQYQCDAHVVKMIVESAQLLSTCYADGTYYRHTHINHPCAIWVRKSRDNFSWLLRHAIALCEEYTRRYGKTHKTEELLRRMTQDLPVLPTGIDDVMALAMPDEFKVSNDPVECYRAYYRNKAVTMHRFRYTNRDKPEWL